MPSKSTYSYWKTGEMNITAAFSYLSAVKKDASMAEKILILVFCLDLCILQISVIVHTLGLFSLLDLVIVLFLDTS